MPLIAVPNFLVLDGYMEGSFHNGGWFKASSLAVHSSINDHTPIQKEKQKLDSILGQTVERLGYIHWSPSTDS